MTVAATIINELISKTRTGWELNGFEDGLTGRDNRAPKHMISYGIYMEGYRDGEQVRKMKEAAADPFNGMIFPRVEGGL